MGEIPISKSCRPSPCRLAYLVRRSKQDVEFNARLDYTLSIAARYGSNTLTRAKETCIEKVGRLSPALEREWPAKLEDVGGKEHGEVAGLIGRQLH